MSKRRENTILEINESSKPSNVTKVIQKEFLRKSARDRAPTREIEKHKRRSKNVLVSAGRSKRPRPRER